MPLKPTPEFEEIAHSGGTVTFTVSSRGVSGRAYSVTYTGCRPVKVVLIDICAHYDGDRVAALGFNEEPPAGWLPVTMASDSEGSFGHQCPACNQYWRSGPWPRTCPYCRFRAWGIAFLTNAQKSYVKQYCQKLREALDAAEDGDHVIDMDAVADAAGKEGQKPAFYYAEESQQRKFTCGACGEFNDILGRFGYCSSCETRNDLADFEEDIVPTIRARLNAGNAPEDCVRDAVAAFDSFVAQLAKQLAAMIPLTERRKRRLSTQRFHNLQEVRETLKNWFDIDVCAAMKEDECRAAALMFHRRHVYEHNGGEVDQKYLDDSGDTTVRLKQRIHQTQQDGHSLLNSLVKMARNIHGTFHELFPPIPEPIRAFEAKKARTNEYAEQLKLKPGVTIPQGSTAAPRN